MAMSSRKMIKVNLKHGFVITLCAAVLLPTYVLGGTVEYSLTLPMSLEYENNPRLQPSNAQSVRRTRLRPDLMFMFTQNNDAFTVSLGGNIERSSNQSASADRDDQNLELGWTHRYERGEFGLTAALSEQSTRTSEFDETGVVANNNTRRTRSISANWNTALTERYTLTLSADATKVEFDTSAGSLNDYENKAINAQLGYSLSEQVETYGRLSFSRFEPVAMRRTNFRSLDLGATWSVTEQLTLDGNLGINRTSGLNSESGWQAMFDVSYETLRSDYSLSVSRSRSPSGSGIINESNQLTAGWMYRLSDKENIGLDVNYRENLSANKNETSSLSANYTRELAPAWDFRLATQYRNRDDVTSDASSTTVTATVIYKLSDF